MKSILAVTASAAGVMALTSHADEFYVSGNKEIEVQVGGQFMHTQAPETAMIENRGRLDEVAFRNEIVGKDFQISVTGLAKGEYTVLIGEAETYLDAPGGRIFDISYGDQLLATNLDIFKAAGGKDRAYNITAKINYSGPTAGPLSIAFRAEEENAKFNTFEIQDSDGKSVVTVRAVDFLNGLDPAALTIPEVSGPELWKDSRQPVEARVADLVSRMSIAEKACQLDMYKGSDSLLGADQKNENAYAKPDADLEPALAKQNLSPYGVGAIHDLYPNPKLYNSIQSWVIHNNRLGIPALFIEEGLHGYMGDDETIFPQSVNLATTWNVDLAKAEGTAIASEARADGVDMILGPVLDIARDPRWGRVEEDFGEDPFLSGQLGLNYVRGMQGESLATDHTVIAEPKHFAAHGSPESGLNTSSVHMGEREVRSVMLKSFEPPIREGGAMGVMAAYHDIDGVPCTGNPWLLNTVLRDEWGFKGFVLSDLGAVRRLYDTHHVAASPADAVCLAINSGVDMQFYDFDHQTFEQAVISGVRTGKISMDTLDKAVSRILRVKFMLGLFDHPYIDENLDAKVRRSPEHLKLALEIARQSMCLLKNQGNVLPLSKDVSDIAVIGPNADAMRLGDYAGNIQEAADKTVLQQIKKIVSPATHVFYSNGDDIAGAVALAKRARVAILCLGENSDISGEWHDRSDLGLPGNQEALLEAVAKTGVPTVLLLQNGRALSIPWATQNIPAILEAWYPGEFGGRAMAETLFGDNNPAGRLSVSFPKNVGQLPVYYNHFPSKNEHYVDGDDEPEYFFGFGLSYTTFKYSNLQIIPSDSKDGDVLVRFDVQNTGNRDGDEVAQVYAHETTASVATPIKSLMAFSRVHLAAGESRTLTLLVRRDEFAIWGAAQKWAIEPGEINIMVGGNSEDNLSATFMLK